jgi:cytochrome c biogenesis protein CcmG/thiol:disulfide interchange protein DsbE
MRGSFASAGVCTLLAVVAIALLSGCGSNEPDVSTPTPAEARSALAGAPAPLASLHRQASELLPGGQDAFDARLATLRGRPVVVNAWASWCGPCRYETAFFQRTSVRFGRRVAFLGVNPDDETAKAEAFLREHPVAYPSYVDPGEQIAHDLGVRAGLPTTVFIGRDGRVEYVKQGQYRDEQQLVADIERYAGQA